MAAFATVAASTDITAKPAEVLALQVTGGSDVAEYEVRDGDSGASTLVSRCKAPINDTRQVRIDVPVNKLRLAKVSGTASEATVYYR